MKNQYKLPLILFLIGIILTIVGSLFKLMHWPGATIILTVGMLTEVAAIITLIVLLIKHK
ncbi:GldL-related protein [Flavobacterium tibetense]|jgi:hypothetical protein|uniref:Gliding motility protein GldL-like N-terminal domain-containing protein n=1 Tax=Flavobacterium tibetense TaxID=2233533 RepID=A0A365P014_9FLAO|nr:hypothetical protein [Flavobacterium tibetense]RBA27838.1 hypothetical protein DPN68_10135 [Flavobacterium tibetense]